MLFYSIMCRIISQITHTCHVCHKELKIVVKQNNKLQNVTALAMMCKLATVKVVTLARATAIVT